MKKSIPKFEWNRHGPGLVNAFRSARRSSDLAVLEGFHAVKHAVRFNARILTAVTDDRRKVSSLARDLAPDLTPWINQQVREIDRDIFRQLAPQIPGTRLIGISERFVVDTTQLIEGTADRRAPIVILEAPARLGNVGAVIRVAAALGAGGVLTTGTKDPWDPMAIRGSAGLHYAVPVARWEENLSGVQNIVAIDPGGEPMKPRSIPDNSVLVFGTERQGLSPEARRHATVRLGIPMNPGVSSINLATAVAITLFTWRLRHYESFEVNLL